MSKKNEKSIIDVKDMEKNVSETARQIWLAGLGALASAKEEGTKLYDSLIEKGTEFEKKGKKEIESLVDFVKTMAKETESSVTTKVTETIDEAVKRVLERFDIPSRDEVKTLITKVETLAKKVEDLTKKAPAEKTVA